MAKTILFQGDSITDCGRERTQPEELGRGYPRLIASELGFDFPEEYTFYNRGISGNRIVDVYARIKADIINLKPDVMSLLIGVNDVWHEIDCQNGVSTEKFEKIYNLLIQEIKAALPDIKILIMEPFVLPGSATCDQEDMPDRWNRFSSDVYAHAAAAKRVAEANGLSFVQLQDQFTELDAKHPGIWLVDGVHPTAFGHQLIKRQWLKAFSKL